MVITASKRFGGAVVLTSKDARFREKYWEIVTDAMTLIDEMGAVAEWANNTLNEECLFEVE